MNVATTSVPKHVLEVSLAALFAVGCARSPVSAPEQPGAAGTNANDSRPVELVALAPSPAAVVELFTSEGCSSCPPADENLAAIADDGERKGQRVFTLEFHVDYWNDLGWVDPFSSPTYSERQRVYARELGLTGIYTPQMVVNGREELVGSRRDAAQAAIRRALATPATIAVAVKATRLENVPTSIQVDYQVSAEGAVDLNLALALDTAQTQVTRGENANRTLRHRHVVLAFATRHVEKTGTWLAPWPASARGKAGFVVAYVNNGAAVGAESASIPALR